MRMYIYIYIYIYIYTYESISGYVPTKEKQTPPLSFGPTFMKDAHYAETNEKTNFRFL